MWFKKEYNITKKFLFTISSFFSSPFSYNLDFTFLIFAILIFRQWALIQSAGDGGLGLIALAFGISYIVSLPIPLLKYSKLKIAYKIIILLAIILITLVQLWMVIGVGRVLTANDIDLFVETNAGEASNFLSSFFRWKFVLMVILLIIFALASYIVCLKFSKSRYYKRWITSTLTILGIALSIFTITTGNLLTGGIDTVLDYFKYKEAALPLEKHQKIVEPFETTPNHPKTFVLIIGESYAKRHSSVYGYDKITNPRIMQLIENKDLIAFGNVSSPAPQTTQSFKWMFTTISDSSELKEKWQQSIMLPTVIKRAGYETSWISTQGLAGINQNVPTRFANLCDTAIFLKSGWQKTYDETILPEFNKAIANCDKDNKYRFIILHLWGSHFDFKDTYPESRKHFKASDYPKRPSNQRKTVADYDNSILYNDSIMGIIFNNLKSLSTPTIALYLPDHGQDIYVTNPTYASHGINSEASIIEGCKIPMFLFANDAYKFVCKEMVKPVEDNKNNTFKTSNVLYLILDLMGYNIKDRPKESYVFIPSNTRKIINQKTGI